MNNDMSIFTEYEAWKLLEEMYPGRPKEAQLAQFMWDALCTNHTGKMTGMWSLSTSCLCNKYCLARMKDPNFICSKCYSERQMEWQENLRIKLYRNTLILTTIEIPVELMPRFNVMKGRLESHGELNNVIQIKNFFNLCKANPRTMFALWTKNTFLFPEARKQGVRKPGNLIIIESSPKLNVITEPSDPWVDKVFTVFNKKFAREHGIEINCGGRCCMTCETNCYKKNVVKGKVEYINELVK